MSYLKHVKSSLHKASLDTTKILSAHLRSEARASGWPDHIVRSLHVAHQDGEFSVHGHPDHRKETMDLEYGTPGTQPTAAIRRFSNRTREAEKFLMGRTMAHLGRAR